MSHALPILSVCVGSAGMLVSGLCLGLVLLKRRTWWHFAGDVLLAIAFIAVGLWVLAQ